jgi:hypothetical protein
MFVAMTVFELQKPPEIPRFGRGKKEAARRRLSELSD